MRYTDELTHWKYTKREKVGNKWRYWYESDECSEKNKAYVETSINNAKKVMNELFDKPISDPQKAVRRGMEWLEEMLEIIRRDKNLMNVR